MKQFEKSLIFFPMPYIEISDTMDVMKPENLAFYLLYGLGFNMLSITDEARFDLGRNGNYL